MSTALKEPLTLEMIEPAEPPTPAIQRTSNVSTLPVAGPMGNALAFIQAGGTMDQLRDMLALQREWEAGEARKAFVQAMTDFKAEPLEIFKRKAVGYKTADGGFVGYKHAELADVADVVVPAMAKHGLSHRWDVKREGDRIFVTCVVMHRLGHSEAITMDGAPDNSGKKNAIQQQASTITYLQRYTLLAATGLATKDVNHDDDGAGGKDEDECPTELLQAARDASLGGWKAFAAWIKGRTEEERKQLDAHSASLKEAAKKADQEKEAAK